MLPAVSATMALNMGISHGFMAALNSATLLHLPMLYHSSRPPPLSNLASLMASGLSLRMATMGPWWVLVNLKVRVTGPLSVLTVTESVHSVACLVPSPYLYC